MRGTEVLVDLVDFFQVFRSALRSWANGRRLTFFVVDVIFELTANDPCPAGDAIR